MEKRILLIEDNDDQAATLSEILNDQGYRVKIAGNGITGSRLARESIFDLIVMDVALPGRDGI